MNTHLLENITITDGYLGNEGLEIGYLYDTEEKYLELDANRSGEILQSAKIIDEYKNHRVVIDGYKMDWKDFVATANIQQEEYLIIVKSYLLKKVCDRINNAA